MNTRVKKIQQKKYMRKYHDLVLPMKSKEKNPGAEN